MTMTMTSKRVGHEVIELVNYCGPVSLETQNTESGDLVYMVSVASDSINISFILDRRFPFSPPYQVLVNNKEYLDILKTSIVTLSQLGIEKGFPKCFCCESLMCADRWNASVSLVKLFTEIKDVISKKQQIMHIWFSRKLAAEKLTHDIPIENYL